MIEHFVHMHICSGSRLTDRPLCRPVVSIIDGLLHHTDLALAKVETKMVRFDSEKVCLPSERTVETRLES